MAQRGCLIGNVVLLKVASYGGMLSFELQYTLLSDRAQSYYDADVEIIVSVVSLRIRFSLFLSVVIMLVIMPMTVFMVLAIARVLPVRLNVLNHIVYANVFENPPPRLAS